MCSGTLSNGIGIGDEITERSKFLPPFNLGESVQYCVWEGPNNIGIPESTASEWRFQWRLWVFKEAIFVVKKQKIRHHRVIT